MEQLQTNEIHDADRRFNAADELAKLALEAIEAERELRRADPADDDYLRRQSDFEYLKDRLCHA